MALRLSNEPACVSTAILIVSNLARRSLHLLLARGQMERKRMQLECLRVGGLPRKHVSRRASDLYIGEGSRSGVFTKPAERTTGLLLRFEMFCTAEEKQENRMSKKGGYRGPTGGHRRERLSRRIPAQFAPPERGSGAAEGRIERAFRIGQQDNPAAVCTARATCNMSCALVLRMSD
jgi:hypothetical protein